jgi:hypothetical protein
MLGHDAFGAEAIGGGKTGPLPEEPTVALFSPVEATRLPKRSGGVNASAESLKKRGAALGVTDRARSGAGEAIGAERSY